MKRFSCDDTFSNYFRRFSQAEVERFWRPMWRWLISRGFLHIPAKRFNPGSRRQSGLGSDPDFSQFPNDFVHVHRLWLFTEFVASV